MGNRLRRAHYHLFDDQRLFADVGLVKALADSVFVGEAQTFAVSLAAVESVVVGESLSTAVNLAASDGVIATEAQEPFSIGVGVSDTVYGAETLSRVVAFVRSLADTAYGTETVGQAITPTDLADDAYAGESLTWHMMMDPITEDVSATDATPTAEVGKALADSVQAAEALVWTLALASFTDSVTVSDSLTPLSGLVLSDAVAVAVSLLRVAAFVRSFSGGVQVAEADVKSVERAAFTDSVQAEDALSLAVALALAESAAVGDALAIAVGKVLSDSLTSADALFLVPGKAVTDSVWVSEALGTFSVGKGLADVAQAGDVLSRVVSFARSYSDTADASDAAAKTINPASFGDGVTVGDEAALAVALHTFFERVRVGDTLSVFDVILDTITDTVSVSDDIGLATSLAPFLDQIQASETLLFNVIKALHDTAYVNESLTLPTLMLNLFDVLYVSDALLSLLRGLILTDTVYAADSFSTDRHISHRMVLWGDAEGRATGQVLRLVEGDTLPVLVFLLTDADSGPYDLATATVTLRVWDRDETIHVNAACTVSEVDGVVTYNLVAADTDTPGEFWACLVIEDGGEQYTSESFVLRIRAKL